MLGFHLLNSAFLAGLAAVALPIVIHLIYRRKSKEVPFPDLRLLRNIDQRVARRQRLEELILLALRCAALALVALALARPLWKPEGMQVGSTARTSAVIVLDNSYSMGAATGGVRAFDRAKQAAGKLLDLFRGGDQVALLPVNGGPSTAEIAFSSDLRNVAAEASNIPLSFGTSDLAPRLSDAVALLKSAQNPGREIYVITDEQSCAWTSVLASGKFKDLDPAVRVYLLSTSTRDVRNCTVESVELSSGSKVRGAPFRVTASVANSADAESETTASLFLDGRKLQERPLRLAPHGVATVSFSTSTDVLGLHFGEVRLSGDALAADNAGHFALDVTEGIRVLVCDGNPNESPYLDEVFYLVRALDPSRQQTYGRSIVFPTVITPADLAKTDLSSAQAVLLANVPAPEPAAALALATWVSEGGSLAIFSGSRVDAAAYAGSLGSKSLPGGGLLPGTIGGPVGDENDREGGVTLAELDTRHVIFRDLVAGDSAVDFSLPRFFTYTRLGVSRTDARSQVLARFSDGAPALVESAVGEGRVIFFASSAGIRWTNFPVKVSFLPFVHNLVYSLAQARRGLRSEPVGAPIRLTYPKGLAISAVSLRTGGGRTERQVPSVEGERKTVTFAPIAEPGTCEITESLAAGERKTGLVVNVDPREGDLTPVDRKALMAAFPAGHLAVIPAEGVDSTLRTRRDGIPMWDALLWVALLLLLGECLFANRIAFGRGIFDFLPPSMRRPFEWVDGRLERLRRGATRPQSAASVVSAPVGRQGSQQVPQ